jgi:hypothetical protein
LVLAASATLVCFLALLPQLINNGFGNIPAELNYGIPAQLSYGQKWGNLQNLTDPAIWIDVLASFFLFSIFSPVSDFIRSTGGVDWQAFLSRPGAVLTTSCLCGLYMILLIGRIRSPTRREVYGPVVWLMLLIVWSVYFNPGEVLLYMSVPLGVLAFIVGCVVRDIETTKARKTVAAVVLSITFLTLLSSNWLPVFN